MSDEKHDPWELLREARKRVICPFAHRQTGCCGCTFCAIKNRIDAALEAHDEDAQDEDEDEAFAPTFQRAFVNGCDVELERCRDGAWLWWVHRDDENSRERKRIATGAADSEGTAKMLALRTARSVQ
jgi:hypothetical protein